MDIHRAYRYDGWLAKFLLSANPNDERRNQKNSNDEKHNALGLFDRGPTARDRADIYISSGSSTVMTENTNANT